MPDIKYNVIKNSREYNDEKNQQYDDGYRNPRNNPQSEQEEIYHGELLHQWTFDEFEEHSRGKIWYIVAGIFIVIMTIYCINTNNFLFLVIIIMSLLSLIMFKFKKPEILTFSIYEDGIDLEGSFVDWEEIKEYYIIYFPERNVKKLYFIFKKASSSSISIDLENENPLLIRETLNQYITENTVRKYEHLTDQLSRLFKL